MIAEMAAALLQAQWLYLAIGYIAIGAALTRAQGTGAWLMGVLGWPMELAQRFAGQGPQPYLFLLPNVLVFGLFTFAPLFMNMGFSATEGSSILFQDRDWAGTDNLVRLLGETQPDTGAENREDDKFLRAVTDTAVFVVFQVPIMVLFALITALVLNRDIAGRGFWRSIFFYPVMLSPVVVGFLWTLILKRQGVLSVTLMQWGWIDAPIQWLTDPGWTMFWSVFVYTWAHLGFYMLILLAGLQAIPADLYEAAEMDGTSPWRALTHITIPLLMPTLLVVFVLSLIKAFQAFEELFAMQVSWISVVAYIFETSGLRGTPTTHGLGIAATASLLIAAFLGLLSVLQIALSGKGAR
ncbi:Lactose transport system permease protein LacF [Tritonibacter multivorans]|uniref:Lactose transport system permease protein LacF n=1 Tax=Tritonibacter multivorans TaxID=928856 RepID=A0A0P1GR00_9RHOB|nr:sugar ABC transporter permease [Tritonibacter multivorans]MDA7421151.1 sugar ABC transporter permease [Tritonibacter multivorans]CUH77621.1 Lactose transport system permease protein LacF [Tritonibacter multivorans]SFD34653.1 carbohydrate ABC transporter membrane protein 1, CUT1 family [Tritonibacter multivorans]